MVQSLNLPALLISLRLPFQPRLIIPHITVPNITHLRFAAWKELGIRAVVIDKDNTLTAPYDSMIFPGFAVC